MFKGVTVGELRAVRIRSLRRRSDGARRNVNWLRPRQAAVSTPRSSPRRPPADNAGARTRRYRSRSAETKPADPLVKPVGLFRASSRGQQWHAAGTTRRARSPEETIYLVFRGLTRSSSVTEVLQRGSTRNTPRGSLPTGPDNSAGQPPIQTRSATIPTSFRSTPLRSRAAASLQRLSSCGVISSALLRPSE